MQTETSLVLTTVKYVDIFVYSNRLKAPVRSVDFVVLRKQGAQEVTVKAAINWSLVWVGLSLAFNGLFWWAIKDSTGNLELANTRALEFLTGYLIEKSLAVDNIFVFLMIFTYFSVPAEYQKRVLMYGIIGAIVLRTVTDPLAFTTQFETTTFGSDEGPWAGKHLCL